MKDSVIIVSGGMDSITLLHEKAEEIALAVTFDYGSNHNKREAECAARHCQQLGIEHIIIPLAFIGQYFKSSLLEGADAVPEGHYEAENMKSTVVPFRNGIMLSVACGLAESRKLSKVLIANHHGDHAIYPDCRAGFVHSMSEAMRHGTYIGVQIDAPYTGISKSDIARIGKRLGIDYSKTYSCYKASSAFECGKCGTCVERKEAFKDAGITDPTPYEDELNLQPIEGFDDYFVSARGEFYSQVYGELKKMAPYKVRDGYLRLDLFKNGERITVSPHRIVAQTFISNPENKPEVNHIDGNKSNNCTSNLEWVTHSENMRHAYDNGLCQNQKGGNNGNCKLSDDEVKAIRQLYKPRSSAYNQKKLAQIFNVSVATIDNIVNNRTRVQDSEIIDPTEYETE